METLEPCDETHVLEDTWLMTLPFVYTEQASSFFEEQLVARLPQITKVATRRRVLSHIVHVRAAVCVAQLEERSRAVTTVLQNLQTALSSGFSQQVFVPAADRQAHTTGAHDGADPPRNARARGGGRGDVGGRNALQM